MTRLGSFLWMAPACLMLSACSPWTIRPIESEASAATSPASMPPARYVDAMWDSKLLPAISNSAVDARTLLDTLAKSPADAISRYAHREANGPAYFQLKGEGVVASVDSHSRIGLAFLDVPPLDHQPDVSIQIGPVLRGTALRDSTGLVRFTDFVNQLQYADVANELNDRVLKTVLNSVDRPALQGKTVSFLGVAVADTNSTPPLRDVVPIALKVENVE